MYSSILHSSPYCRRLRKIADHLLSWDARRKTDRICRLFSVQPIEWSLHQYATRAGVENEVLARSWRLAVLLCIQGHSPSAERGYIASPPLISEVVQLRSCDSFGSPIYLPKIFASVVDMVTLSRVDQFQRVCAGGWTNLPRVIRVFC